MKLYVIQTRKFYLPSYDLKPNRNSMKHLKKKKSMTGNRMEKKKLNAFTLNWDGWLFDLSSLFSAADFFGSGDVRAFLRRDSSTLTMLLIYIFLPLLLIGAG